MGSITDRWAVDADPPEGEAGHAQGLGPCLRASQHILKALSRHLCWPRHCRRHQLELLPVKGEKVNGKFCDFHPPWSVVGIMAHLEVILMLEWDLRAGATVWLSSARTDWSRLSFTTYWLLLEGCHSTPKILEKEKQGQKKKKNPTFFPLALSPGDFSLYISKKRTFWSTKSPTSLAECRKGKSIRACLLPRCGRRQHQVRTSKGMLSPMADAGRQSGYTTWTCTTSWC